MQNTSIGELKQQLAQQQNEAARQMKEVIEKWKWRGIVRGSQKRESQRQADAYEQQIKALRNHLEQVTNREQQRLSAIKNRVDVWSWFDEDGICTERFTNAHTVVPIIVTCIDSLLIDR